MCFLFLLFYATILSASATNNDLIYNLQKQVIDNPRNISVLLQLAIEYTIKDEYVDAVETYFKVLRLDPENFHAYNNLGILYRKSGQFKDSLFAYSQAEKIDPDSYWVPYNMGLCYEAMGRMQEARENYGRALSLNPSFTLALDRLRLLSDLTVDTLPLLPPLDDSQMFIVDSKGGKPRLIDKSTETIAKIPNTETASTTSQNPETTEPTPATEEPQIQLSQQIEEKNKQAEPKIVRTSKTGPSAEIFNQAMEALEEENIERALELYVRCVIAERTMLAEPENNLIKLGLQYLKDRPNRMPDGLFYRGFLISVSGDLKMAASDLSSYLETLKSSDRPKNNQFAKESRAVIERYEQQAQHLEELAKENEEKKELARIIAEMASKTDEPKDAARPSDSLLKHMSPEQLLDEADKFSRSRRYRDAIAILEVAIENDPNNIDLLMRSANAYADLMLQKNDVAAGKMAMARFEKIYNLAPDDSKESQIAKLMINELHERLR